MRAAITTMLSAIMMVWLMPVSTLGSASGNCTFRMVCRGVAPNISAASTVATGTVRMPRSVSLTTGGSEYTTVAMMAGTRATPNSSTTGIRYTKAGRVCMASSTGRSVCWSRS